MRVSLERLPDDAYQLLCRSAVYRCPVPDFFWLAMLPECSEERQEAALNLLKSRAFAEEDWKLNSWLGADGKVPLRQHNLIRNVAYELLRRDRAIWQDAEHRAAQQWLNVYEPAFDIPNLETVRGYLEAFYHYCEVEDWDAASELFMKELKPSSESGKSKLHRLLYLWGYYQEQLKLCQRLLNQAKPEVKIACQHGIGLAHNCLANYHQATTSLQEGLTIAREIGDRRQEGAIVDRQGVTYFKQRKYQQALDQHQQSWKIAREINDRESEGCVLGNLGNVYNGLMNYPQAIECLRQSLEIAQETGNLELKGINLGNLGLVYKRLEDYPQALEYYGQYLEIAGKITNQEGKADALGNLGIVYSILEDYSQAIDCYGKSLEIARKLGLKVQEGRGLCNLGTT